mgnify:CR=1 FL=1
MGIVDCGIVGVYSMGVTMVVVISGNGRNTAWCVGEVAMGKYRKSGDLDVFNTPYLSRLKLHKTIILLYYIVVRGARLV